MYKLGMKTEVMGSELTNLKSIIPAIYGRPSSMPHIWETNAKVVCGFDQGLGEKMFVVESLQDMQELYDKYAAGYAVNISWYIATIAPKAGSPKLGPDYGIAGNVINQLAKELPLEVKQALAKYSMGNPGAATVLAQQAQSLFFTTVKQVEDLVGWPLSEHTEKRASELWDRFKK